MVHWVLVGGPERVKDYGTMLPASGLPFLRVPSMRALNRAYAALGLARKAEQSA